MNKTLNTITKLEDSDTIRAQISVTFDVEELRRSYIQENGDEPTVEDIARLAKEWFIEEVSLSPFYIEVFKCDGHIGRNETQIFPAEMW